MLAEIGSALHVSAKPIFSAHPAQPTEVCQWHVIEGQKRVTLRWEVMTAFCNKLNHHTFCHLKHTV